MKSVRTGETGDGGSGGGLARESWETAGESRRACAGESRVVVDGDVRRYGTPAGERSRGWGTCWAEDDCGTDLGCGGRRRGVSENAVDSDAAVVAEDGNVAVDAKPNGEGAGYSERA